MSMMGYQDVVDLSISTTYDVSIVEFIFWFQDSAQQTFDSADQWSIDIYIYRFWMNFYSTIDNSSVSLLLSMILPIIWEPV